MLFFNIYVNNNVYGTKSSQNVCFRSSESLHLGYFRMSRGHFRWDLGVLKYKLVSLFFQSLNYNSESINKSISKAIVFKSPLFLKIFLKNRGTF